MTSAAAVLWDIDGTLIDSEPLHVRSLKHVLVHNGLVPSNDLHQRTIGKPSREIYDLSPLITNSAPALRNGRGSASTTTSLTCPAWPERRCCDRLPTVAPCRYPPGLRLECRSRAGDGQPAGAGLANLELVTISRNDVSVGKPHPEGYLRAAERLAVKPQNCLVIEDSPTGALAGLAAGMSVLAWPDMTTIWPEGVTLIGTITEVLAHPAIAGVVSTART